jgi:uncharacterized linocin/CFP29 family protein
MDRNTGDLGWSDEQWSRASKLVQQEAQRARVAAQFLPIYVQGDTTATAVPRRLLQYDPTGATAPAPTHRMSVDSDPNISLTSLAVNVFLTSQEANDPEQSAALIELRRAANLIARLEDALLLRGQDKKGADPAGINFPNRVFTVSGGGNPGLYSDAPPTPLPTPPPATNFGARQTLQVPAGSKGPALAAAIIKATTKLEAAGHNRPFACVLGQNLYTELHDPTAAMILPRDRVVPVLEGPLLRSSTLPDDAGIVVALGGSPIEIVVSSELHLRFLQITTDPWFVLRVSERIALRVTDWSAILSLYP